MARAVYGNSYRPRISKGSYELRIRVADRAAYMSPMQLALEAQGKDGSYPLGVISVSGINFRGEQRSNQTHESKSDPEAQLARKSDGKESKLSYSGNPLVENRNGLIVDAEVFQANGTAERDAALVMLEKIPGTKSVTVAGDNAYDTRVFV